MATSEPQNDYSDLVLGWQVTSTLEPRYWLTRNPKPGKQSKSDLVTVPPDSINAHTAIIAQSGSGKSFFLGRLIEEIILHSLARCLILDLNADFARIDQVAKQDLWKKAEYDFIHRRGKLPDESCRQAFESKWSGIRKVIRTTGFESTITRQPLKLRWTSVSADFFSDDADATLRNSLYHCHAFVKALEPLLTLKSLVTDTHLDTTDEAESLLHKSSEAPAAFPAELETYFSPIIHDTSHTVPKPWLLSDRLVDPPTEPLIWSGIRGIKRQRLTELIESRLNSATKIATCITKEGERIYFAKVDELKSANILETAARPDLRLTSAEPRLEVIDLTSFGDRSTHLLAVNAILAFEWSAARARWRIALNRDEKQDIRVPTFIVVDEAHNLIPTEARTHTEFALREQFRTIVAEGRKYGLFVILASQRPDKLDPFIVSECENKAIMKISSHSVLQITRERLGLEDIPSKTLEKSLDFEMGRGLLIGPWTSDKPVLYYCAARRTIEGGRNLWKEHWARSPKCNETESALDRNSTTVNRTRTTSSTVPKKNRRVAR